MPGAGGRDAGASPAVPQAGAAAGASYPAMFYHAEKRSKVVHNAQEAAQAAREGFQHPDKMKRADFEAAWKRETGAL